MIVLAENGSYIPIMSKQTKLIDLVSVGPAIVRDLALLGITRVDQLRGQQATDLFEELKRVSGKRQDPCVLDVFTCAIAQAENPDLPDEQRQWWYWSRVRKSER